MRKPKTACLALMLGAVTAACGGQQTPSGPTSASSTASPSAPAATTPTPATGVSISGVVHAGVAPARALNLYSVSGVKVSVIGTSIATMTDPSGQFVLNGVPPGSVTLSFEANGVNGGLTLNVSEGQQVSISVTMNGSNVSLDGSQALLGTNVEIQGVIAGLGGVCPSLTFTVNGKAVKTDATTSFDATPCTNLLNGDRAEVQGTLQPDNSVLARKVEVNKGQASANVQGIINGLTGTCPTVTFVISGTTIKTTASTGFDSLPCVSLADGQRAEVKGTIQLDSSLLALKVEATKAGQDGNEADDNSDDKGGGKDQKGGDGNKGRD